ncbi:MAG: sigma-70 family RNA polymerase sigma factor [Actinomycetes bacterium]
MAADSVSILSSTSASVAAAASPPAALTDADRAERFERFVVPEIDVLWRVSMSITRHRADAEDVVQETLLRAFRSIETFDGRHPRAWLLAILRNAERNRHRRRRPELLADPDATEVLGPATPAAEVEQAAEDAEFAAVVAGAVAALPDGFREVVDLVDVNGLTYHEAAELLDVPIGTVMSRLHRARRRLRDQLGHRGFGPTGAPSAQSSEDGGAVQ